MNGAGAQAGGGVAAAAARDMLEALRFHWDTAYQIEHDGEDGWRARRLDGLGGRLAADSPDGLFAAITADYTLKPVPRPEPGA